jgi:hypothetical protein
MGKEEEVYRKGAKVAKGRKAVVIDSFLRVEF